MLNTILSELTRLLQPYSTEISVIIVATLLVIYGDVMNKHIKRMLSPYHFVVRTTVFVLLCAFGYGALLLFVAPHLHTLLLFVPTLYRGALIVATFLLLGYLAENRRYI